MATNDLHEQWIAFCRRAVPGARFWIGDELYSRLWAALSMDARWSPDHDHGVRYCITYRGGYEYGGLTFYTKAIFPNPPRRAPGRQEFYAR